MRRLYVLTGTVVVLCLSTAFANHYLFAAAISVRVNERATILKLEDDHTAVALALENLTGQPLLARIEVELLDTQNRAFSRIERVEELAAGQSVRQFSLAASWNQMSASARREFIWYRLRYRVTAPLPVPAEATPTEGIISLSEITPELFTLQITAPEYLSAGSTARVQVRALHPASAKPVRDVKLTGVFSFADKRANPPVKALGVTDANGYARLEFPLPIKVTGEASLKLTGQRGDFAQEAEEDIQFIRFVQIMLQTDKPLYQPGQTLHLRALVFGDNQRVLSATEINCQIKDPENNEVFRTTLKTSEYGIASFDWPIPANMRLGNFRIEAATEDEEYSRSGRSFKISRYELPNFAVSAQADRTYYLPGQDATVEVRADYLFGQPVTRGHVRLVREAEREWNYLKQKWEIEEADTYEGKLDAAGRFILQVKLAEAHEGLQDRAYRRFDDLHYTAYVTDATSGRTEQRQFDVRVTKAAIHIYAIHEWRDQAADFPLEFFLTANYADGSPAACDIAISAVQEITGFKLAEETRVSYLQTVRTNRYGIAKVSGLRVPRRNDEREQVSLQFRAQDAQRLNGESTETFYLSRTPIVRVTADKTLLQLGEAIEATITASDPNMAVTVDLVQNRSPLQSQFVQLRNGQARVRFAYQPNFKGLLTVAAYAPFTEHNYYSNVANGAQAVLYPQNQDLQLDVQMSRTSYQPGAAARTKLRVRNAAGQPVNGVLGLVVYDKAIDERARTDAGFDRSRYNKGFVLDERDNEAVGGISLRQLNQLDLKQGVPEEFELAAQVLLRSSGYRPKHFNSERIARDLSSLYQTSIRPQITVLENALDQHYEKRGVYPTDENELRRTLELYDLRLDELPDPWGQPYRALFSVQAEADVLELFSAGADKQFETADDFRVLRKSRFYFAHHGAAINRAVERYHVRTGAYLRDLATLQRELLQEDFEAERWRDRWGHPYIYQFGIERRNYTINVLSSGPDGQANTQDDFGVWTARIDWFAPQRFALNQALNQSFKTKQSFPQNEAEWRATLQQAGIDWEQVRDAWGRNLLLKFSNRTSLAGTVNIRRYTPNQTTAAAQQPVTQNNIFIALYSVGADGKPATGDDFEVANFLRSFIETTLEWQTQSRNQPSNGLKGAIAGVITDASGAVIPNVVVKAIQSANKQVYQGRTNSEGYYLTDKLPVGLYDLRFEAPGFKSMLITSVPSYASNLTRVDATLEVGTVSEAVAITADAVVLQTESASVAGTKTQSELAQVQPPAQTSTPRLREYFPETLLWQPQLITDRNGRAQLNFKLADNITTWKLAVVASTLDGKLGVTEHEFRAFQPFFIEHDPPPILTEGDEISLPILVRNYTEQSQKIAVEMKAADWFTLLGPAQQTLQAAVNEAARALFTVRATASVEQGKQRVLAFANSTNDAIEKPITVHPDGEEVAQTAAQVFTDRADLELTIPDAAFKNSRRGEVKIYPNLRAHVLESLEGVLRRPYGCGEQTISSTYPNLLALHYYQRQGGEFSPVANKAKRFLQEGYERLLTYHAEGSGFGYWSGGNPDPALTAYALRFLQDARTFIQVDEAVINDAALWLLNQNKGRSISTNDATTAAYIAYSLAIAGRGKRADKEAQNQFVARLRETLKNLTPITATTKDAYLLACYAMAATELGEKDKAGQALVRLRTLAQSEAGTNYWEALDHTPFHGWGLAGRIETTALAIQALVHQSERDTSDQQLLNRGLAYLLRNKDRYGVWHSTQATINTLKALIAVDAGHDATPNAGGTAEIFINGQRAAALKLPPSSKLTNPLSVDLSRYLTTGKQRVEIRQIGQANPASAQLVMTHYQPWATRQLESQSIKLNVQFDKTTVEPNESVTCNFEIARFKGTGMVMAEIGLPPGAQVERGSLDQAIRERGYSIDRYDVLPDRVVFYLWPGYGSSDTKLSFQFRPRLALKAQSAPSLAYDYYNPEARAVVPPVQFVVR